MTKDTEETQIIPPADDAEYEMLKRMLLVSNWEPEQERVILARINLYEMRKK